MSQSYIPDHTKVVCTNMTTPAPGEIRLHRGIYNVKNTKGILLTKEDKKLTAALSCKNASKFWGGLMMLCAGIALGALVVLAAAATVATGGLAAIAFVALGAMAAASISGIIMAVQSHDCDYTLDAEWQLYHTKVKYNGSNALLQGSMLKCSKGGVITIFMDAVLAQQAATEIAKNNSEEVKDQLLSKLCEGFITGITGLNALGICIGSVFSIKDFWSEENESEEKQGNEAEAYLQKNETEYNKDPSILNQEEDAVSTSLERDIPAGIGTDMAGDAIKGAVEESGGEMISKATLQGAGKGITDYFTEKSWNAGIKGSLKGGAWGLLGSMANAYIDKQSNDDEEKLFKATTLTELGQLKNKDSEGINVAANQH